MTSFVGPAIATALLSAACSTYAAGGHHGVDDASLMEPGTCEVESWAIRHAGSGQLLHAGATCRVGPVELGLSSAHARDAGASRTGRAIEAKWAREWWPGVSAGLSVNAGWEAHRSPRYQGTTVMGLLTWTVRPDLALHVNAGRDFLNAAADQPRYGGSAEWTATPHWSLNVERYLEARKHFVRAGARWTANDRWRVDFSRAQGLHGPKTPNWTLGVTWSVDRR